MKRYTNPTLLVKVDLQQEDWENLYEVVFLFRQHKQEKPDKDVEKKWTKGSTNNDLDLWTEGTGDNQTYLGFQIPFSAAETAKFTAGQQFYMDTRIVIGINPTDSTSNTYTDYSVLETNIVTLTMNGSLFDKAFTPPTTTTTTEEATING